MERIRLDWDKKTSRFTPTKTAIVKACRYVVADPRYRHSQSLEELVSWSMAHVYALRVGKMEDNTMCFSPNDYKVKFEKLSDNHYIPSPEYGDLVTILITAIGSVWFSEPEQSDAPDAFA